MPSSFAMSVFTERQIWERSSVIRLAQRIGSYPLFPSDDATFRNRPKLANARWHNARAFCPRLALRLNASKLSAAWKSVVGGVAFAVAGSSASAVCARAGLRCKIGEQTLRHAPVGPFGPTGACDACGLAV